MRPILEIHKLSKRFSIRHQTGSYLSLRERITDIFQTRKSTREDFWALKDVSFEVQSGESLGIIGRNGAGKSTILKVLSRITPPTAGKFVARGRIASLLEVGTGFHPELAGRENIFFNGSLLGMRRREIQSKFDEIVDFSGVEMFLDTPLKHYSSGMQLRLAFAVAAFLEPEILVIDEVLAVGDAEFQKKCIGKMKDVSRSGRTVLFVSHNMQAILSLCPRSIYLKKGQVACMDSTQVALNLYAQDSQSAEQQGGSIVGPVAPSREFGLRDITLLQNGKQVTRDIDNGSDLIIEIKYRLLIKLLRFRVFVDVCDQFGSVIFRTFHDEGEEELRTFTPGDYVSKLVITKDFLAPVAYEIRVRFTIHNERMLDPADGFIVPIQVKQTGAYNSAYLGQYTEGMVCPTFKWEILNA